MEALKNQTNKLNSRSTVQSVRNNVERKSYNSDDLMRTPHKNVDVNLNELRINNRIESFKSASDAKEEGKLKSSNHRKKSEVARERWKILAKALLKPKKQSSKFIQNKDKDVSVRRFTSFELLTAKKLDKGDKLDDCWFRYTTKIQNNKYTLEVHHVHDELTAKHLIGFNNTGNICIWPSEEVLTYYLLTRLELVEGRKVLELGGGMTCLAGIAVAKYGRPSAVHLTDGNALSVDNVKRIVTRNQLSNTTAFVLEWGEEEKVYEKYDVVLSADCLFFDEARTDLVRAIWQKLAVGGTAFVLAPRRGNTLDLFVMECVAQGFLCSLQVYYNDLVWKQHSYFKEQNRNYQDDIHYPILLVITIPTSP